MTVEKSRFHSLTGLGHSRLFAAAIDFHLSEAVPNESAFEMNAGIVGYCW
jgi:hypothetical protein